MVGGGGGGGCCLLAGNEVSVGIMFLGKVLIILILSN